MEPIPSVKDLASSEPSLRRKNLQQILTHLEKRSPTDHLAHEQALQLWRGFHVALYMHDSKNQLSVQTLIATLASTFKPIRSKDIEAETKSRSTTTPPKKAAKKPNGTSSAAIDQGDEFSGFDDEAPSADPQSPHEHTSWLSTYTAAFWETIIREWSGIDQWRMNKYLLLIRFVLRELFTICLASYFGIEDVPSNAHTDGDTTTTSTDLQPTTSPKTKKRKAPPTDAPSKKPKSDPSSTPSTQTKQTTPARTDTVLISQLSLLTTYPLQPRESKISNGLRLHLLDIYLDELMTAYTAVAPRIAESSNANTDENVADVLKKFMVPVEGIATDGLARQVRVRAKEVSGEVNARVAEVVG